MHVYGTAGKERQPPWPGSATFEADHKNSSRCRISIDSGRAGGVWERGRVVAAVECVQQIERQSRRAEWDTDSRVKAGESSERHEILIVYERAGQRSCYRARRE